MYLSYRSQVIDLLCKSMNWFLHDGGLRHGRTKLNFDWIANRTLQCFKDIALGVLLSPGDKGGGGFNFCLQRSIARWGPSLSHKSFGNSWDKSYSNFITDEHASFHLWWKENLLNYQKVSKYYEHDCKYWAKAFWHFLKTLLMLEFTLC